MAGRTTRMIIAVFCGLTLTVAGLLLIAPRAGAAPPAAVVPPAEDALPAPGLANGVLTLIGNNQDNTIEVGRVASGTIVVSGVVAPPGTFTVGNTELIQVFGLGGNDVIRVSEANGAMPRANLFPGSGDDVVIGGSGGDMLFGQAGADTLEGKGGVDQLFGGDGADTLRGGDADDRVFGEAGNDRLVWGNGDDTDLAEGGPDSDTVQVDGSGGTESFTATANGTRVRFDRVFPSPFSVDIGTTENLTVDAGAGDDRFEALGDLGALVELVVDGGPGTDTVIGGNGADVLLGGDGDDVLLGAADDDVLVGGPGTDALDGGPGANVLLGGETTVGGVVPTKAFLTANARDQNGGVVLGLGGRRQVTIPGVTVAALLQEAAA